MGMCAIINMALLKGDSGGYSLMLRDSPSPPPQMTCLYLSSTSKV